MAKSRRVKRKKPSLKNKWFRLGVTSNVFKNANKRARYQIKQKFVTGEVGYYPSLDDWHAGRNGKYYKAR